MPSVLLLHTNSEYATSLARTLESIKTDYSVDVVTRTPISDRLSHLLFHQYDLIQTDEFLGNGVLAYFGSTLTGTPLVVSVRGWADYTNAHDDYGWFRESSIRARTKLVLGQTSKVMYISEATKKVFENEYEVKTSTVTPRPVNVERFRTPNSTASTASDETQLVTVTNLRYKAKYDGVVTILNGLIDLFDEFKNLRYCIAGDGEYAAQLTRFLDSYPHRDRVEYAGYVEDVPTLLSESIGFVYVSYLDSLATVVLEAQAAGLPIIGGNAVGVPEAVGDAGLICPPTADGVRNAVGRLLKDSSIRDILSEKSRKKMEAYNERCARQHVDVWNEVLGYS
jgi:glycosyltransferase involved in cell wall biosynthesis